MAVRLIAVSTLRDFWTKHPGAQSSLERWIAVTRAASWKTTSDVQASFSNAKALDGERVRFEVSGGSYRLIVAFKFASDIAFVKFVGTHAEYDRVDALTVNRF